MFVEHYHHAVIIMCWGGQDQITPKGDKMEDIDRLMASRLDFGARQVFLEGFFPPRQSSALSPSEGRAARGISKRCLHLGIYATKIVGKVGFEET
jgi:hypothetical protein